MEKLCTAGIGEGVLPASLIAQKGMTRSSGRDAKFRDLSMTVGGLIVDPKTDENSEFVTWFRRNLKVGDKLTFSLRRSDKWDEPTERKKPNVEFDTQKRRECYEHLKKEFEPSK